MTSLAEVYDGNARGGTSLRRLYAGTTLVLAGGLLAVLAVLVAATDVFVADRLVAREYGGILGGLAAPVVLVGVFVVLPASRRVQAAAAISASICLLGVALFRYAYPSHWDGYGQDLTLFVSGVYLLGFLSAIWCLFTAVATFKTRNDPGGALEMNVTRLGRTKVVEVEGDGGLGSVGFFGGTPDGEVETQTNEPTADELADASASGGHADASSGSGGHADASTASDGTAVDASTSSTAAGSSAGRPSRTGAAPSTVGSPTGDGGSATGELRSPPQRDGGGVIVADRPGPTETTDRYCGNCTHFEYVRSSSGMTPYCGLHGERMEDMDACEEWTPNHD